MTKISKSVLLELAQLAKVALNENEIEIMANQVQQIISFADKINDIESLADGESFDEENFVNLDELRPDVVQKSFRTEELLKNASSTNGEYISVPKSVI